MKKYFITLVLLLSVLFGVIAAEHHRYCARHPWAECVNTREFEYGCEKWNCNCGDSVWVRK